MARKFLRTLRGQKMLVDKLAQSQQTLDQAQARVDQLISAKDADSAAIEAAETQLGYTTITSPLNGRIGIRTVAGRREISNRDGENQTIV